MPVRTCRNISTSLIATIVTFFVVSGLAGYLARSLVDEKPPIRIEEACAELYVDATELKRKYLNDLAHYARRYLREQKIPFVAVKIVRDAVAIELPESVSHSGALAIGEKLNFPLLSGGAPALKFMYQAPQVALTPTPAMINERLLASANGNVEHLKSQYTSLGVSQFRIERTSQSGVLVRVPTEVGRKIFSKAMGAHPVETSIRFFRSVEKVKGRRQAHGKFRDRVEPGWFDPDHTYHLSSHSIVHEGQLASVEEVLSQSGARLLRLHLQSDAAHRLVVAAKNNPNGRLSLSVHNRVVSIILTNDIDTYGVIDFPVPADSKELQAIFKDIKLSFAQTVLKAVNVGTCT